MKKKLLVGGAQSEQPFLGIGDSDCKLPVLTILLPDDGQFFVLTGFEATFETSFHAFFWSYA